MERQPLRSREAGFSLIEVLVSMLIFLISAAGVSYCLIKANQQLVSAQQILNGQLYGMLQSSAQATGASPATGSTQSQPPNGSSTSGAVPGGGSSSAPSTGIVGQLLGGSPLISVLSQGQILNIPLSAVLQPGGSSLLSISAQGQSQSVPLSVAITLSPAQPTQACQPGLINGIGQFFGNLLSGIFCFLGSFFGSSCSSTPALPAPTSATVSVPLTAFTTSNSQIAWWSP